MATVLDRGRIAARRRAVVRPRVPTLRRQLYLALLALSVPVWLWFGYEAASHYQETLREEGAAMRNLAAIGAADVERFLSESKGVLARLAARPAMQAMDRRACDAAFAALPLSARFEDLVSADRSGRIVCSALPAQGEAAGGEDRTLAARPAADDFTAGEIRPGRQPGSWLIDLSYPVRGDDGAVVGRLSGAVNLLRFHPVAARAVLPDGAVVGLVDGQGVLLARSLEPERHVGRQVGDGPMGRLLLQGRDGTGAAVDMDGTERVFGHVPVRGTDWVVYAGIPAQVVTGRTWGYVVTHFIVGASTLGLMLVFGVLLMRRVEQPIARIAQAARAIGDGRAEVRLQETGPREVVELGRRFNAMLDTLAAQRRSIEDGQARLLSVLNSVQEVVYSGAPDGSHFSLVSPACERVFGYPADQFYRRPELWLEMVLDEDRGALAVSRREREQGETAQVQYRIRRADGSIRWMQDRSWVVRDEGGRALRVDGLVHDITERRYGEQSLRESELRFRSIAESSPVPLCIVAYREGRVRYVNEAFSIAFGIPADQVIGRPAAAFFADPADLARSIAVLKQEGRLTNQELPARRADGRIFWVVVSARRADFEGVPAVFVSYMDITARRQAEESLRASEERFRTLVAALAEGVALHDATGRTVTCNAAARAIFGNGDGRPPQDSLIDGSCRLLRAGGVDLPLAEHPVMVSLASGKPQRDVVLGMRRDDGSEIWLSVNTQPLFHPDATRPYAVVSSFNDITGRVRAESAIRELNETLERRVVERTAELEHANRELESFSYSVSHDLRAPLRSINGFSHIIKETERARLSEEGLHLLDRVIGAANRMGQLIDDILRFSRASRTELQPGVVDLGSLVRAVADELREAYPAAGIEIGELPRVRGDLSMLRQVLANLIENALKFSAHRSQPRVEIGSRCAPGGETVCYVRDNGAGFDMRYAGRLFGVFQRMHSSTEFAGTGVGLAVVKRIVERHKGRIWAEAEPDKGACFSFILPAVD
jgi:PAS domain S-box-containing protein